MTTLTTADPLPRYEITVVYSEPESLHWEAVAAGKSLTLAHRKRIPRPGCTESWNEECWQLLETTEELSAEQMRSLIEWSAALVAESANLPSMPAPGSANMQLLIRHAAENARHLVIPLSLIPQLPAAAQLQNWLLDHALTD